MRLSIDAVLERNLVPDPLVRLGIRRLLRQRLRELDAAGAEGQAAFDRLMAESPIAVETGAANAQHYEVPTAFYQLCLGTHLKYSSGYWLPGVESLDAAEACMLRLTTRHADLKNGQNILELGCGWGSLTLWMARTFPASRITAVSNSRTQKEHIDAEAARLGLANVTVLTADMNTFAPPAPGSYDRVVSVEMFEHMRNWRALLDRIATWLRPDGKLFVHIFVHRRYGYEFADKDASDWMSRYFFTGGIMPPEDVFVRLGAGPDAEPTGQLRVVDQWRILGTHYGQTAAGWLANMDRNKKAVLPLFAVTYGEREVTKWWVYWRVFFMACEELWNHADGREWFVSHYLLAR